MAARLEAHHGQFLKQAAQQIHWRAIQPCVPAAQAARQPEAHLSLIGFRKYFGEHAQLSVAAPDQGIPNAAAK